MMQVSHDNVSEVLVTVNRYDDFSTSPKISMLSQIDPLPCAKIEPAVCYGNGERVSKQGAFDVGGHIVTPFVSVNIVGFIVRYIGKKGFEIFPYTWICIFVDRETCGSVL